MLERTLQHRGAQIFNQKLSVKINKNVKVANELVGMLKIVKNEVANFMLQTNQVRIAHQPSISSGITHQNGKVFSILAGVVLISSLPMVSGRDINSARYLSGLTLDKSGIDGTKDYARQVEGHHIDNANLISFRGSRQGSRSNSTSELSRIKQYTAKDSIKLINILEKMGRCKHQIENVINIVANKIPSQSYETSVCEPIYNDGRIVDDQLHTRLESYGSQTCLHNCEDTLTKISANLVVLDDKWNEIKNWETELSESPIVPGDDKLWDKIKSYKRIIEVAKENNILLRTLCENLRSQAERVRADATIRARNLTTHCSSLFYDGNTTLAEFNDDPDDTSYYKMKAYVTEMTSLKEYIDVLQVQLYNQMLSQGIRFKKTPLASPRIG